MWGILVSYINICGGGLFSCSLASAGCGLGMNFDIPDFDHESPFRSDVLNRLVHNIGGDVDLYSQGTVESTVDNISSEFVIGTVVDHVVRDVLLSGNDSDIVGLENNESNSSVNLDILLDSGDVSSGLVFSIGDSELDLSGHNILNMRPARPVISDRERRLRDSLLREREAVNVLTGQLQVMFNFIVTVMSDLRDNGVNTVWLRQRILRQMVSVINEQMRVAGINYTLRIGESVGDIPEVYILYYSCGLKLELVYLTLTYGVISFTASWWGVAGG